MLIPLSWLRRYVAVELPAEEIAHRLTMAGIEVESIETIGAHLDPELVVAGEVIGLDPHPNADRLRLPTVDLGGGETSQVVCGAPNVAVGQKIAFARLGARLIDARSGREEPLRPAMIRGFESRGMVCSERELGLGDDHEGILVLDGDVAVGRPLADIIGDVIFDVAVTPNRPDCLSVLGVAREVAALTGQKVNEPPIGYPEGDAPADGRARVSISDSDLCRRYTAALIEGVSVGPSPKWLRDALERAGQRSINNIVDVTNFVMLELNQPLHAFDFDLVGDGSIIVRQAVEGETMRTLDGEDRDLSPPMLVIADPDGPVGLAGVMGGASTEVSASTSRILLESANFDPVNTRLTGAALRLSTGASYRFERGLRPELAEIGLRRAARLIAELAGGTVARGIIDVCPRPEALQPVSLSEARLSQVLGTEVPISRAEESLSTLGFETASRSSSSVSVLPPYWRSDVAIEDDLVEEVARMIGYDQLPLTMLSAPIPHQRPRPAWQLKERIRDLLAAAGMREIITYNLVSADRLRAVGGWREDALRLANPLNEQLRYLRTTLRAGLLQAASDNIRIAGEDGLRLFELGRTFHPSPNGEGGLPEEREMLAAVLCGSRSSHWWQDTDDGRTMDMFDAKGAISDTLRRLGLTAEFEDAGDPALGEGRAAAIIVGGQRAGTVGEVDSSVLAEFGLDEATVAIAEIELSAVLSAMSEAPTRYRPFSRYPESLRDLALVVDAGVSAQQIGAILAGHKLVRSAEVRDVYTGKGVPPGKKSLAFRLTLQSDKGTLTSDQASRVTEDLLRRLNRAVGAVLRA